MELFYFQYACTHTTLFSSISNSIRLGELYGGERKRREEKMWKIRKSRLFVLITQNVPTKRGRGGSSSETTGTTQQT